MSWQGDGTTAYTKHVTLGAAAVTDIEFYCGVWYRILGSGTQTIWSFDPGLGFGSVFRLWWTSNQLTVDVTVDSTLGPQSTVTWAPNVWGFTLVRIAGGGGQGLWINHLTIDGTYDGAAWSQTGLTTGLTGFNNCLLGAENVTTPSNFLNGNIAEFWCARGVTTNLPTDAAVTKAFIRQLAYQGPLSIPSLAPKVIMYLPLLKGPTADSVATLNATDRAVSMSAWQFTGAGKAAPHPPLPYSYRRRRDTVLRNYSRVGGVMGDGGGVVTSGFYQPNAPMGGL